MKKTWVLLIAVLALGIIALFVTRKPVQYQVTEGMTGDAPQNSVSEIQAKANEMPTTQNPPTQGNQPTPQHSNPWNELQTPEMTQSLVSFAEKLSPKMEEAEANLDKAREFFTELEGCVSDSKTNASPIQALCLSTAEELAEIHPEMMERYRSLRSNAPGQVTQMLDAADAMEE
ncbi:MAG: hypothetical protein JNL01_16130 [Bdellovibrionales bacterium]|nr:hypothetical protein [Bdellovibrionales bacterium]